MAFRPGARTTGTAWRRRCGGSSIPTWSAARATPTSPRNGPGPSEENRPVMKLTTEPGALAAAVKFAARVLTARAAYPILGGLKITASPDGGLEVTAFDHETSARARIDAEVGEHGTVL